MTLSNIPGLRRSRRSAALVCLLGATALGVAACGDDDDDGGDAAAAASADAAASYEVTITNLTSSQPLTPPVAVAHADENQYLEVGAEASAALQAIAENGDNSAALAEWDGAVQGGDGPLAPADIPGGEMFPDAVTFTVDADAGETYLSLAQMLICTNDGFTGVNSLPLPAAGESVTREVVAYDAGTENNTEAFVDIVPPCQALSGVSGDAEGAGASNPDLAEGGTIAEHAGIQQTADLTEAHAWEGPVAEITVTAS